MTITEHCYYNITKDLNYVTNFKYTTERVQWYYLGVRRCSVVFGGKKTHRPPPKPEVILTNFFAEPTVLLVPITSRDYINS
jgi:hypothetical protein